MGAAAMATAPTLRILGRVEIEEKHWALWAESERESAWLQHLGYQGQFGFLPSATDEDGPKRVRQIVNVSARDHDISEAIGHGMERLALQHPQRAASVRARYSISEHYYQKQLAKRLGMSESWVSQMATHGQQLVERWVLETYGDD